MPIYEFTCDECGARFDALADAGAGRVACRSCGSHSTARIYSPQSPSPKLVKTPAQNRRREARRRAGRGGRA